MLPLRKLAIIDGDKYRDEYSINFDGTDAYIKTGQSANSTNITIAAWIKVPATTGTQSIFDNRESLNDGAFLYVNSDEELVFRINSTVGTAVSIETDKWVHVAAKWGGSTMRTYINGVEVASDSVSGSMSVATGSSIGKIHYHDSGYFEGNISEVAVYNSDLHHSKIKALYNEGVPVNHLELSTRGNLLSWWRMGDGIYDDSLSNGFLVTDMANTTIGSDMVTNGGFDADNSWDKSGEWVIGSGVASLDGSQPSWEALQNNADGASRDMDINTAHRVKYTYTRSAGAVQYKDGGGEVTTHSSGTGGSEDLVHVSGGTYWYFTANSTFVGTLDNIEIYRLSGSPGVMTNMALTDYTRDSVQ